MGDTANLRADVGNGSKADVTLLNFNVRVTPQRRKFLDAVPMCDKGHSRTHAAQQTTPSFDHLVGGNRKSLRHGDAKRLSSLEINY